MQEPGWRVMVKKRSCSTDAQVWKVNSFYRMGLVYTHMWSSWLVESVSLKISDRPRIRSRMKLTGFTIVLLKLQRSKNFRPNLARILGVDHQSDICFEISADYLGYGRYGQLTPWLPI